MQTRYLAIHFLNDNHNWHAECVIKKSLKKKLKFQAALVDCSYHGSMERVTMQPLDIPCLCEGGVLTQFTQLW